MIILSAFKKKWQHLELYTELAFPEEKIISLSRVNARY